MHVKSLGLLTDFIFIRFDGEVTEYNDFWIARCPANPNFFWGNMVIFKKIPQKGDLAKWQKIFQEHFADPRIYHQTFTWDQEEEGEIQDFLNAGYKLEKNSILTMREPSLKIPAKINHKINIEIISKEEDWLSAIEVQMAATPEYADFYPKQMMLYQRMIEQKMGYWFGAFLDGKLVGSLGIFKERKIGRFQIVSTHPDFRRQGICSTLVYQASLHAFKKMGIETLVMVADEEYHAAQIYKSVGFTQTQKNYGLCKWQKPTSHNF